MFGECESVAHAVIGIVLLPQEIMEDVSERGRGGTDAIGCIRTHCSARCGFGGVDIMSHFVCLQERDCVVILHRALDSLQQHLNIIVSIHL